MRPNSALYRALLVSFAVAAAISWLLAPAIVGQHPQYTLKAFFLTLIPLILSLPGGAALADFSERKERTNQGDSDEDGPVLVYIALLSIAAITGVFHFFTPFGELFGSDYPETIAMTMRALPWVAHAVGLVVGAVIAQAFPAPARKSIRQ